MSSRKISKLKYLHKMDSRNKKNVKNELNIMYFAPCGLHEGVGGSAGLKNRVNLLEKLRTNINLISYLPGRKFGIAYERIGSSLNIITISVRRSSAKILKAFALLPMLVYGLMYVKKIDIIFAHSANMVSGFPAFVIAKLFKKPLVIDHMDIKDSDTPTFIYNIILRNSDIVLTISRYLEKEATEIGANVVYAPIFIDTNAFQMNFSERQEIREKLGVDDSDIAIGYAGSFSHTEGVPFLLRAFKRLSQKYVNLRLVIVGASNVTGSDDIPRLVEELSLREIVILIPPQPHELMPKYLSALDIACAPKINCHVNRATNPIKIYEYMSMGLPLVASAIGGILNAIENGHDGFLIKPEDECALEKTLDWLVCNQNIAKEVGERAREKVVKNYSQQVMTKKFQDILLKCKEIRQGARAFDEKGKKQ